MADSTIRDRYIQLLLEHIENDKYPSLTHLDLVESLLPPKSMDEYLDILISKLETENYPSLAMLQRVQRLTAQLPAARA